MFIQDALNPKEGSVWRLSQARGGSETIGRFEHKYFKGKLTCRSNGNSTCTFDIQRYSPDLKKGLRVSYHVALLAGMLKYYGEIQEVHSQLFNSEI
jgi:hypothetical protein